MSGLAMDPRRRATRGVPSTWQSRARAGIGLLLLLATGCATSAPPPPPAVAVPSLVDAKRQVRDYVDSGRYEADIAAVAKEAAAHIEARSRRGGKLALVVDVDE